MSLTEFTTRYSKLPTLSFDIPTFFNFTKDQSLNDLSTLFNLGLKHIPIRKDMTDQEVDLTFRNLQSRINWACFFNKTNIEPTNFTGFSIKKEIIAHCPNTNKEASLLLGHLQRDLYYWKLKNPAKTQHSHEYTRLKTLKDKFPHVVFKATDKNLGLSALPLELYNSLVMIHLTDSTTYKKLTPDQTPEEIYNTMDQKFIWHTFDTKLTPDEAKYIKQITANDFKFPKFHILPKVHKTGKLTGRPITGAVNWFTTPLSKIADRRLKSYLPRFENILTNTFQLSKALTRLKMTPDCILITGDVSALYPNIDLNILRDILHDLDPDLYELVDFIISNNYVQYGSDIYLQIEGIATGTNCAVSLANIYLGVLLDVHFKNHPDILYYGRYIDDLIIIWTSDKTSFHTFADRLNNIESKLKINWDISDHSAMFLDLDIRIERATPLNPTQLSFRTYSKPMSKFNYITKRSCHDPHTFSGFIKGELTRYARNSSSNLLFLITKNLFKHRLLNRGYNPRFLTKCFKSVRWSLRFHTQIKKVEKRPIIPWIVPYTLRANHHQLRFMFRKFTNKMAPILPHHRLIFATSTTPSIGQLVSGSSITPTQAAMLHRQTPRSPQQAHERHSIATTPQ